MYRKLVPYDGKRFFDVDQVALRRTAERLRALIPASLPSDEPYGIHQRLLPALKKAIDGAIEQPVMGERELIDGRFVHEEIEGLLPVYFTREFLTAFANFSVTARSLPLDPPEIEIVDEQQCAWMDFEEEGDWPDKVKYP
ncbi:MAG: hypothetical protein ACREPE_03105 [Lysobacter sp.]